MIRLLEGPIKKVPSISFIVTLNGAHVGQAWQYMVVFVVYEDTNKE